MIFNEYFYSERNKTDIFLSLLNLHTDVLFFKQLLKMFVTQNAFRMKFLTRTYCEIQLFSVIVLAEAGLV